MVEAAKIWRNYAPSIFSTMTEEAVKAKAINLAQGFPDFDGPESIKETAVAAIRAGRNQYAPAIGLPELRSALASYQAGRSGLSYDPQSEITVLSGATEALFCSIMAVCERGDEIIAFEPFYDSYAGSAAAAHARLVPVRLSPPSWDFDPSALEKAVSPKTKAIIVNTPHNPTGRVLTRDELLAIADVARRHDLIVITDEVYEELVFHPAEHHSLASLPGMRQRTIVISSTSKTFSFTGWKVGYAFAPPPLTRALRALHQFTVFCSATPLQAGLVQAFDLKLDYYDEFRRSYAAKREHLLKVLTATGFRCQAPAGTYFIVADYSQLSALPDEEFAIWLAREGGVAAVPLSPFYVERKTVAHSQSYVRFAFCKDTATLDEAHRRLERLTRKP